MSINWERPAIATEGISVLLPLRAEPQQWRPVIDAWLAYLDALPQASELILIADGRQEISDDIMARVASAPRARLCRHDDAPGIGADLRAGLAMARLPLVAYTACDPAYRPEYLTLLLKEIDRVDLVAGGRAAPPPTPTWRIASSLRWVLPRVLFGIELEERAVWPGWKGLAYHWLIRLLMGVQIVDITCPFKLFRRSIFERIPIQSHGPFVHAEILAKANFLSCFMVEVPLDIQTPSADMSIRWREQAADFRRVLRHPDFGPARLATSAPAATVPPV
ncbi:MAG: glycosyltransferase [Gemmataceae bacterium]